jgi:hypothetical protein
LLDVVISADNRGPFFTCPRCHSYNPIQDRRRTPRFDESRAATTPPPARAE